jgi:hypothetical protein
MLELIKSFPHAPDVVPTVASATTVANLASTCLIRTGQGLHLREAFYSGLAGGNKMIIAPSMPCLPKQTTGMQ